MYTGTSWFYHWRLVIQGLNNLVNNHETIMMSKYKDVRGYGSSQLQCMELDARRMNTA